MRDPRTLKTVLLILTVVAVFSCTRNEPSDAGTKDRSDLSERAESGANGSAEKPTEAAPDTAYTLSVDRPGGGTSEEGSDPMNADPSYPNRPWRQLLPRRDGEAVLPADFEIGVLSDPFSPQRDRREIASLIAEFLAAYGRGTVREELISRDRRILVSRSLRYPLEEKALPLDFRIGVPESEGGNASSRVRLYRQSSWTDGTVYLVREADRWRITDLQIDFLALLEPSEPRNEPFRPEEFAFDVPF